MIDPFDYYIDPYIEWNEEISAREDNPEIGINEVESLIEEKTMPLIEKLKTETTGLLVSMHDFSFDEAEEMVSSSVKSRSDLWHENADPKDLADMLASDEDDD